MRYSLLYVTLYPADPVPFNASLNFEGQKNIEAMLAALKEK